MATIAEKHARLADAALAYYHHWHYEKGQGDDKQAGSALGELIGAVLDLDCVRASPELVLRQISDDA